ncbi:MAG: MBL fold metallo-hydrolase, partial [Deltaproteobacteria bacterium]|nr:MBL fold metallo-hydrolase [Deltaproteobacteria bacterium]
GCNVGFVATAEGLVLIDSPQRPTDALRWREDLQAHGPVRYLVNTHHHRDHIVGNTFLPGTVVAHHGTRARFLTSAEELDERFTQRFPEELPYLRGYVPRPPVLTFSDALTLHLGELVVELRHLPGHTPNEVIVLVPRDRVVFTGDNLFHDSMPFLHDCDPWAWIEALEHLKRVDAEILVPGHGEVCGKAPLDVLKAFLEEVLGAVGDAIGQGITREETAARLSFAGRFPLQPTHERLGMGPEIQRRNLLRVYDCLTGRALDLVSRPSPVSS